MTDAEKNAALLKNLRESLQADAAAQADFKLRHWRPEHGDHIDIQLTVNPALLRELLGWPEETPVNSLANRAAAAIKVT